MVKILVVEDNPVTQRLVQSVLTQAGYAVSTAEDARAGMLLARSQQPALILMDIQLPGMNGLTAARMLKKDAATRDIRIIAMTAYALDGDQLEVYAAGCDGYIPKPIHVKEFLATVAETLDPDLVSAGPNVQATAAAAFRAAAAGLPLGRAQLRALVEGKAQEAQEALLFLELGTQFQAARTLGEAARAISRYGEILFPGDSGAVYLLGDEDLYRTAQWGEVDVNDRGERMGRDACAALNSGNTYLASDQGSGGNPCTVAAQPQGCHSCIALKAQGTIIGVLHIVAPQPVLALPQRRDALALNLRARTFGIQISLALANLQSRDRLLQQSMRDPLTSLFNRRYLDEALAAEMARVRRSGGTLALIMVDIDHFKRYNDCFGHKAGDHLLKCLGALLRAQCRASDIACRYGGEEFLLVLPDASLEQAQVRAEQLRVAVKALRVRFDDLDLGQITISLGLAALSAAAADEDALVAAADAALYRAKEQGRDRIEVSAAS